MTKMNGIIFMGIIGFLLVAISLAMYRYETTKANLNNAETSKKEREKIQRTVNTNGNETNQIKRNTERLIHNSENEQYFLQNDFSRYNKFFPHGFRVVQQNENKKKPFVKAIGEFSHTDFSDSYIFKRKNDYFFKHNIEFFKKSDQNQNVSDAEVESLININNLDNPQILNGMVNSLEVNGVVTSGSILIIKNTKPYVYAVGLSTFTKKKR